MMPRDFDFDFEVNDLKISIKAKKIIVWSKKKKINSFSMDEKKNLIFNAKNFFFLTQWQAVVRRVIRIHISSSLFQFFLYIEKKEIRFYEKKFLLGYRCFLSCVVVVVVYWIQNSDNLLKSNECKERERKKGKRHNLKI